MAFSEFEQHRYTKETMDFVARHRPPAQVRPKLDLSFRLTNQSIEIFETRPRWDNPHETMEHPVAKATYVKNRDIWKVYWRRADLKWHGYEPDAEAINLREFFAIVEADEYGCFWG